MHTKTPLRNLTDEALARLIISARNRRDAFRFDSAQSADAQALVVRITHEQARRREARRAAQEYTRITLPACSYARTVDRIVAQGNPRDLLELVNDAECRRVQSRGDALVLDLDAEELEAFNRCAR
jgi:hypothetical protein